jgi:protein-tyrosine-phosphatase
LLWLTGDSPSALKFQSAASAVLGRTARSAATVASEATSRDWSIWSVEHRDTLLRRVRQITAAVAVIDVLLLLTWTTKLWHFVLLLIVTVLWWAVASTVQGRLAESGPEHEALPPASSSPLHVAAICTGNICRSPMAEIALRDDLRRAGLTDNVIVTSAGTANWHVGKFMDERARDALRRAGYRVDAFAARFASSEYLATVDLAVVMSTRPSSRGPRTAPISRDDPASIAARAQTRTRRL